MLLARTNIRGKITRTLLTGVDVAETDIFDFSYLSPGDIVLGLMTYSAHSIDGAIQSVGSRALTQIVDAAGAAFETGLASLFGEAEVGVTPLIPDYNGVIGNALASTFQFDNTSAVTMQGVVNYSFSITKA